MNLISVVFAGVLLISASTSPVLAADREPLAEVICTGQPEGNPALLAKALNEQIAHFKKGKLIKTMAVTAPTITMQSHATWTTICVTVNYTTDPIPLEEPEKKSAPTSASAK